MEFSDVAKPFYTPEELANIVRDAGYRSALHQMNNGKWAIRSATCGFNFTIYLYTPNNQPDQVTTVQFACSFVKTATFEQCNKWNREKRFIKAYCDEANVFLEWDFVVRFVSPAAIKESMEWWDVVLGKFNEF